MPHGAGVKVRSEDDLRELGVYSLLSKHVGGRTRTQVFKLGGKHFSLSELSC